MTQERIDRLAGGDPSRRRALREAAAWPDVGEWKVLHGHGLRSGGRLSDANVRLLYLHLTGNLVQQVIAGGFDQVVFLDKSARPLAWFLRSAWKVLAAEVRVDLTVGPTSPSPTVKFVNIDRLQWLDTLDPEDTGGWDVRRMPDETIAGLRCCFAASADALDDPWGKGVRTCFDDQRVLVVDEVAVSGATATMAEAILRRAFPAGEFERTWWMRPGMVRGADGSRRPNTMPTWYRHDPINPEYNERGRGVADRDDDASAESPHWRVRAGRHFLSRPHPPGVVDEPAGWLREEIRAAVARVVRGQDLLAPSLDRPDYEQASELFNGLTGAELRSEREARGFRLTV